MTKVYANPQIVSRVGNDGRLVGRPSFTGLGAMKWGEFSSGGTSNPVAFNKAHKNDAGMQWSSSAWSQDQKRFSKLVYCFQHAMETALGTPGCSGNINPDVKSGDCYNRDGMIGNRTLQLLGFVKYHTPNGIPDATILSLLSKVSNITLVVDGKTLGIGDITALKEITIPASYVRDYEEFAPVSNPAAHIVAGEGTAGEYHQTITDGSDNTGVIGSKADGSGDPATTVSFWDKKILGLKYKYAIPGALGLAGVAAYMAFYMNDEG